MSVLGDNMQTHIATALAEGSVEEVALQLTREIKASLDQHEPILLLVFASTKQPLDQLMPKLRGSFPHAVILSASTAGEFTEKRDAKGSTVMFALAGDYRVFSGMGRGLKANVEGAVAEALGGLPQEVEGYPHRTALLMLDPLSGNGEEATLIVSSSLGEDVRLAGGTAGDDLKMKQTWVGLGDQVSSDALVLGLIFSRAPLGVGVCHGHRPISAPLRVTRAQGNVVFEVNGEPAWQVWARETSEAAKHVGIDPNQLTPDQMGAYLLRYEAGLSTGADYKIRAPLACNDDGSLVFACGIPEGAEVQITESVPERQIESAREAARRARTQTGDAPIAGALVFDCICRNLILNKDFQRAVDSISQELGNVPLAGFETYGEIALDVGEMSGFHNTTTVVLAFPK
jgi:methyl-accepting chemotaxis protein